MSDNDLIENSNKIQIGLLYNELLQKQGTVPNDQNDQKHHVQS